MASSHQSMLSGRPILKGIKHYCRDSVGYARIVVAPCGRPQITPSRSAYHRSSMGLRSSRSFGNLFWEIETLKALSRIRFPEDVALWRREQLQQGMVEIAIDGQIGVLAASLSEFHADPADRLIVATALEGSTLLTADSRILGCSGQLDRLRATD